MYNFKMRFLMNMKWNTIKEWLPIIVMLSPLFVYVVRSWNVPNTINELDSKVTYIEGFIYGRFGENPSYNSSDEYEKSMDKDACRENEDNPVRFAFVE